MSRGTDPVVRQCRTCGWYDWESASRQPFYLLRDGTGEYYLCPRCNSDDTVLWSSDWL